MGTSLTARMGARDCLPRRGPDRLPNRLARTIVWLLRRESSLHSSPGPQHSYTRPVSAKNTGCGTHRTPGRVAPQGVGAGPFRRPQQAHIRLPCRPKSGQGNAATEHPTPAKPMGCDPFRAPDNSERLSLLRGHRCTHIPDSCRRKSRQSGGKMRGPHRPPHITLAPGECLADSAKPTPEHSYTPPSSAEIRPMGGVYAPQGAQPHRYVGGRDGVMPTVTISIQPMEHTNDEHETRRSLADVTSCIRDTRQQDHSKVERPCVPVTLGRFR